MNKLNFGDIEVKKKKNFMKVKKGIKLKDINVDNIAVSNRIKGNNEIVKYYIGYITNDNVIPLVLLFYQLCLVG